jgi:GTP-binding protein
MVIAVNKWDAVDHYQRERIKLDVERKLNFLGFARTHFVSALKGQGLGAVLGSVDKAYAAAMTKIATPKLTRALISAVERQAPPRHGLFRPKLRYAHQGGSNPPVIVIHGNGLEHIPSAYTRYLERHFMETFKLAGTPLRIQYRSSHNPFAER